MRLIMHHPRSRSPSADILCDTCGEPIIFGTENALAYFKSYDTEAYVAHGGPRCDPGEEYPKSRTLIDVLAEIIRKGHYSVRYKQ